MDTRQRKIRSQVALLNMEAAAFYLYALSQGFSDVPSDLKVLKMLVERQADVDQPLPKSYSPKKIRGPLHAAMAISPLMLLTGENLQTRPATHAVLMKTWYHLGNQRPLQLRMVEQALGAFIQSIADNIDDEEDGKSQEDEDIGTEADAGNGETQLSDANVVESDQVGNPSQCDADNDRIESNEQKIRENDLEVRDDETSREECSVPDVQADHSRESSPSGAETEDDSGESEVSQGDVPSGMDDDMHVDDENPKTIDENEEEGESELGGDGDGRRSVEDHLDSEEQPEEDISKKGNKKKKKTKEDSDRDDTAQEDQDENHEGTDDSAEGQEEKEDEVTLPPLADHTDRQVNQIST
ncbi:hypothetical protein VNI00_011967 [Paramarasmius palmivorus]|uniref:Uncharacterized protein n=1 Tax=Paramarasmius palmivorus TaxID=297713 RepID=A0AAW0CBR9_9AGAR